MNVDHGAVRSSEVLGGGFYGESLGGCSGAMHWDVALDQRVSSVAKDW